MNTTPYCFVRILNTYKYYKARGTNDTKKSQLFLWILSENSIENQMKEGSARYLEWFRSSVGLGPNRHVGPYAPYGVQIEQTKYICVGFRHTPTYPASLKKSEMEGEVSLSLRFLSCNSGRCFGGTKNFYSRRLLISSNYRFKKWNIKFTPFLPTSWPRFTPYSGTFEMDTLSITRWF